MGRAVRFLKITFYLTTLGTIVATFSAFNDSPLMGNGSIMTNFQNDIQKELDKLNAESGTESLGNVLQAVGSSVKSTVSRSSQSNSENTPRSSEIYHHGGQKWVFINNQYYLYNPKNTYMIDGVRTYYKPYVPSEKTAKQKKVENQKQNSKSRWAQPVEVKKGLHAYTGKGISDIKKNLAVVKHNMNMRNQVLKDLSKEDKPVNKR